MNATTRTAPLPAPHVRSQSIYLDQFEGGELMRIREELTGLGLTMTSIRTKADLVVVPDGKIPTDMPLRSDKVVGVGRVRQLAAPQLVLEAPVERPTARPALEQAHESARILGTELARRSGPAGRVSAAERFARVCLDQAFLEAAGNVAQAVKYGLPCALEGETAAAKTTAILWVAHHLNQPVIRLNLNGQTDTGELIGRFVPDDRPDARSGWRFQEGAIPQAMRHGWWVVLDEMNLAEPQVLERLNPVLEEPASLLLSEGDGTSFGPGGDQEVHPSFRLFATLNPAEYAGRSVLSPAFRDRWTSWNWVEQPDEKALQQTVLYWAFGEQPAVPVGKALWQGEAAEPVLPGLSRDPAARDLLERVARFHVAIAKAGRSQGTLGRNRREPYVFTRRTLWTALTQVEKRMSEAREPLSACLVEVLQRVYGQRMREPSERGALLQAFQATGIA